MADSVSVSGVWLIVAKEKTEAPYDVVKVLVEFDGEWREVVVERAGTGPVSHIVEPEGIRKAPVADWL